VCRRSIAVPARSRSPSFSSKAIAEDMHTRHDTRVMTRSPQPNVGILPGNRATCPQTILTRDTSAELTLEVRPTAKDVVSPPVGLLTPDNGAIGELAGLV